MTENIANWNKEAKNKKKKGHNHWKSIDQKIHINIQEMFGLSESRKSNFERSNNKNKIKKKEKVSLKKDWSTDN